MKASRAIAIAGIVMMLSTPAKTADALEIIINGGFESGFAGWAATDQVGSAGAFFLQAGTASPVNGFPVPAPPQGTSAAMTDSEGPGSHVLYQDFVVPASVSSAILSFRVFVASGDDFRNPPTLDWFTPTLNQQARVDILAATSDPFSIADSLLNAFQTLPGDPLTSGYTLLTLDVTSLLASHVGETLRLRFAEVDNVIFFNFGVDDVHLLINEPGKLREPASVGLVALAVLALVLSLGGERRRIGSR